MTVYISGKISGLDYDEAYINFERIERRLKESGITDIFNPMKEISADLPYREQMRLCIEALKKCDCILLSHNWKDSPGAREELTEAMLLGLNVRYDRPDEYEDIRLNKHIMSKN